MPSRSSPIARRPPDPPPNLKATRQLRRTPAATAQRLDIDRPFDALDERRRSEALPLQEHAGERLERRRGKLRDATLQRGERPLAQRAARLAEHLLGPLQLRIGRAARQGIQPGPGGLHARAHPRPQPLARLGGQRRTHHAPGLVGLAVNQPPPRRPVRDLPDVHAAARRLTAQNFERGIDRRHDAARALALARPAGRSALTFFRRRRTRLHRGASLGARARLAVTRALGRPRRHSFGSGRGRTRAFTESATLTAPATATATATPSARTEFALRSPRLATGSAGTRGPLTARRRALFARRSPLLVIALVIAFDFVTDVAGGRDLVIFHGRSVLLITGRLVVSFEDASFSQCSGPRLGRKPRVHRLVCVAIRIFQGARHRPASRGPARWSRTRRDRPASRRHCGTALGPALVLAAAPAAAPPASPSVAAGPPAARVPTVPTSTVARAAFF